MLVPALFGENLLDDFFREFDEFPFYDDRTKRKTLEKQIYGRKADRLMRTDIKETADHYILAIDLPGFKKEELQVSMENGYLTITANKTEDKNPVHYLRKERYTGSLQRTFYIGEDIRQEEIKAQFKHGVLELTVPKEPEKKIEENKYISIE